MEVVAPLVDTFNATGKLAARPRVCGPVVLRALAFDPEPGRTHQAPSRQAIPTSPRTRPPWPCSRSVNGRPISRGRRRPPCRSRSAPWSTSPCCGMPTTQGAISTSRPEGKALKAFLQACRRSISRTQGRRRSSPTPWSPCSTPWPPQPGLITSGKRETALITAATTSLATALEKITNATLDGLNTDDVEQIVDSCAKLRGRNPAGGHRTVLDDPKLFYIDGPDGPEPEVVERVGEAAHRPDPAGLGRRARPRSTCPRPSRRTASRRWCAPRWRRSATIQPSCISRATAKPASRRCSPTWRPRSPRRRCRNQSRPLSPRRPRSCSRPPDRRMDTLWPDDGLDPAQNLARGAVVAALDAVAGVAGGTGGISPFTTADMVSIADAVVGLGRAKPGLMSINPGGFPISRSPSTPCCSRLAQQKASASSRRRTW